MIFPAIVKVRGLLSLEPAAVDLIENEPVTLRIPVAPAYLPVPPVITALPVISTAVGASASFAQPLEAVSKFAFKVLVPSLIVPAPLIESHWLAGADEPLPVN